MIVRLLLFLLINFSALAIGGFFTGSAVQSDWYVDLNKAPWTPPGWVFGFMWTTIMIAFSVYMAAAWNKLNNRNQLIVLFAIQWVLNVGWNPVFFYFKQVLPGLIVIVGLTVLIGIFLFKFQRSMKTYSILILPYFLWLLIATSLNGYILLYN